MPGAEDALVLVSKVVLEVFGTRPRVGLESSKEAGDEVLEWVSPMRFSGMSVEGSQETVWSKKGSSFRELETGSMRGPYEWSTCAADEGSGAKALKSWLVEPGYAPGGRRWEADEA